MRTLNIKNYKNTVFKHYKGNLYLIIDVGYDSENKNKIVVYRGLHGTNKIFTKPLETFCEKVNKDKYPFCTQEYKFEFCREQELPWYIKLRIKIIEKLLG